MFNSGLRNITILLFFNAFFSIAFGQDNIAEVKIKVIDNDSIPLQNVTIEFTNKLKIQTNTEGIAIANIPYGSYTLKLSSPNYKEKKIKLNVNNSQLVPVQLISDIISLDEVIFTAKEDKGLTSKSVINQQAMAHLQPSSFTDLLELLPGGLAKDPDLTNTNAILLRENTGRPSNYATTSLGTLFVLDNNVLNTNSDLQKSLDGSFLNYGPETRYSFNTGIDMRSISTNDIEKVEIIRGIPSASYGDLTTGLVKIERKIGNTPLQARIKVDGFSKQYYVSKGFKLNEKWALTTSFDLLDAKTDPSNETDFYKRITASVRSKVNLNLWNNPLEWRTNLDYVGTLDQIKIDPDNGYSLIDRYKSYNRNISFSNNFVYQLSKSNIFNKILFNSFIRQGFDKIAQTKLVQYTGPRSISVATEEGVNIGYYPDLTFVSDSYTDGKPLDINAKLQFLGSRNFGTFISNYEIGSEWRYSKNNGLGEIYDVYQPPSPSMTTRPRSYKDIPAIQNLAFYLDNTLNYTVNKHKFALYTGLRTSKLLGIDKSFKISKKIFVEPRINFQYDIPSLYINNKPLAIDLTLGYGEFYKQPTSLYLYPNKKYTDYLQLNYYGNDPQYRYANYQTYVQSLENKNLTAAKNIKKEIRIGFSYNMHNLSITYYRENLNNGFRNTNQYAIHSYREYDAAKVNLETWGPNGPDLTQVPYTNSKIFSRYTLVENGSVTKKEGIEFQYSTPRFKSINTRFTLNGAWFKTKYYNSVPVYEYPSLTINGAPLPYLGIYKNDDSYTNSNLNYNLMIDTYLPSLDLTMSASIQGTIFTSNYKDNIIADPYAYMDLEGNTYDYTEADKTDLYKKFLIRNNVRISDALLRKTSYTVNVNLKVTKSIYKSVKASMFVNRLFNYNNPYYFNGVKIKPFNNTSPYFGMEINYNF